jgi:predicted MFS family arabinose efflux permease
MGPTLGVLVATGVSTRAALIAIAGATLVVGLALTAVNPPTRSAERAEPSADGVPRVAIPRSAWFGPALVSVLGATAGAALVLTGTDVAIVAHLREDGAVALTGMIFAAWGTGSIVGGLVYGGVHRELSPFWLLLALGVLTVPVGLVPGPYLLVLTILPAAAMCAPVIAATAEGVSRLVPEEARGEAMGWHGSALQVGTGLGAPLAGVAMDATAAWAGFATVGVIGALLATAGLVVRRANAAGRRLDGATPEPSVSAGRTDGR